MIAGVTCAHCLHAETCVEGWREMVCSDYAYDWEAIEADPAVRRQGRAEKKRIRKRIREEIAALSEDMKCSQ